MSPEAMLEDVKRISLGVSEENKDPGSRRGYRTPGTGEGSRRTTAKRDLIKASKEEIGRLLFEAAERGDAQRLESLLTEHAELADVDWRHQNNGRTPLLAACKDGHTECTALLIANGANVAMCNDRGVAPLHVAAAGGHYDCILTLLRAGADKMIRDRLGKSAVDWSMLRGHHEAWSLLTHWHDHDKRRPGVVGV